MNKAKQTRKKQERIIEAVRNEMAGDAAMEFVHQSGYAMSASGIARHLRAMGGRGRIEEFIAEGESNLQILEACFPEDDFSTIDVAPPSQGELFRSDEIVASDVSLMTANTPLYATTKLTIRVPPDLYEAIRLASRVEGKPQNQLIVEILTTALSQVPEPPPA